MDPKSEREVLVWNLIDSLTLPQLILNDGSNTPVAQFHRKNLGIVGKAQSAHLEIFPAGEGILDTILVTFIYIENLRKVKEAGKS
jgi:hypothetical protein